MRPQSLGWICATAALLLDQTTKQAALNIRSAGEARIEILPFLDLVLVRNDGISFGLAGGMIPQWALVAVAIIAVAALGLWLKRSSDKISAAAFGLIIGGALGNAVDRLRLGAVTDFLDLHVGDWHWPAFNFADTAIFCGVVLLLGNALLQSAHQSE